MKNLPLLYSFRRCPYAIRARLTLVYCGIEVELREVKLTDKPTELIALSSKATVPVLQLTDSSLLDESLDIMRWALSMNDPQQWAAHDDDALVKQNDNEFKPMLDRYKYADRYLQKSQHEHRLAALPFLDVLNCRLQQHTYLSGDRQTMVDAAIVPFIRQFAGVDGEWFEQCEFEALRKWLKLLLANPLFQKAMQKYAFWRAGDEPVYF